MPGGPVAVLQAHVVDFQLVKLAETDAVGQRRTGVGGVDVDAHRLTAADDDSGICDLVEAGAKLIDLEILPVDDELGAISELVALMGVQEFGVDGDGSGLGRVDYAAHAAQAQVNRRSGLAQDMLQRAADNCHYAQAAGVDHAGLFEHGQLLGSEGQGFDGALVGHLPQGDDVPFAGVVGNNRRVRRAPDHRQHRPFTGLADGVVGRVGGGAKGGHGVGGVDFHGAGYAVGKTAQQLRQDDAAVAAGSPEGAGGDGFGHFAGRSGVGVLVHLLDAGAQREQHVGAGVAVGDGEDVEGVGGVPVQFHVGNRAEHGLAQIGTLERGEGCCHTRTTATYGNGRSIAQGVISPPEVICDY